jgi:hypothetical protein
VNNRFAFLPMRPSNDLLGDPDALRARMGEDSYLLFRRVIDRARIVALRADVIAVLARLGWTDEAGRCLIKPLREEDPAFIEGYQEIQKLESFHTLAHDAALVGVMQQVLGETAFPHPLKIARIAFPDHFDASTPPHQDFPNNQGTSELTATWIPLGPIREELGGLAVLRGSHRHGLLPLAGHVGAGNRQAVIPPEMAEELRWVTTDFGFGDVLLFNSLTVHAALHNATAFFPRLSVDFRWQLEGQALTPGCLEPHFGRLGWDEVYAGWSSTEHQRYWERLDFEVEPFEVIPIVGAGDREGGGGYDQADLATIVKYQTRVDARYERRLERLAEEADA